MSHSLADKVVMWVTNSHENGRTYVGQSQYETGSYLTLDPAGLFLQCFEPWAKYR